MQPKKAAIRFPRSPCLPTAASNRRAWVLLTTVRGSTVLSVRGRVHLTAFNGVGGQNPGLHGVLHQVVQYGPFPVGRVRCGGGSVLLAADPGKQRAAAGR